MRQDLVPEADPEDNSPTAGLRYLLIIETAVFYIKILNVFIKTCNLSNVISFLNRSKQILCVNLDKNDYNLYYNGCCNASFWPLFHSMPDRAKFNEVYWQAYR